MAKVATQTTLTLGIGSTLGSGTTVCPDGASPQQQQLLYYRAVHSLAANYHVLYVLIYIVSCIRIAIAHMSNEIVVLPKHDLSQPQNCCSSEEGSDLMMGDEESRGEGGGGRGAKQDCCKAGSG